MRGKPFYRLKGMGPAARTRISVVHNRAGFSVAAIYNPNAVSTDYYLKIHVAPYTYPNETYNFPADTWLLGADANVLQVISAGLWTQESLITRDCAANHQ